MKKITLKTKLKLIASALALTSVLSVGDKAEAKSFAKDEPRKESTLEERAKYHIESASTIEINDGSHDHEYTFETMSFKPNFDGTHYKTVKNICPIDSATKEKTDIEDCNYVVIAFDKDGETLLCPRCLDKVKRKHSFDAGKKDETGKITYTCKHPTCHYSYTKEEILDEDNDYDYKDEIITPHIHTYTWSSLNELEEIGTCSCGNTLKRAHSLNDWTYSPTTDKRTCNTCDYEETRNHTHELTTTITPEKETTSCSKCGFTETKAHVHNFSEWVYDDFEGKRTCSTCGKVETADHIHDFDEWTYTETEDSRTCSICHKTENREHNHEFTYEYEEDFDTKTCQTCGKVEKDVHNHEFSEWSYNIDGLDKRTCETCKTVEEVPHNHEFNDWTFIGENKDAHSCNTCHETEQRTHEHQEKPEDLEYSFNSSNNDGTHSLTATYECDICHEEVIDSKNENCHYDTEHPTYEIYSEYNSYNTHHKVETCDVCGYENKTIDNCVKTGDLQFIKIYSTIYEYYKCALCNGYVDRKEHVDHVFGEWEIDDTYHTRYCGCIEAREKDRHTFEIGEDPLNPGSSIATCNVCGYTKPVLDHEHAQDEMGLMDLVMSPYYSQLVSKSQYPNPNPSPDDYCSRYDIYCPNCKNIYSIHYAHKFVNGKCTRTGYCGGIEDPTYTASLYSELQDTINSYNPEEKYTLTLTKRK